MILGSYGDEDTVTRREMLSLSLSFFIYLSRSHTHTHTHTHSLSLSIYIYIYIYIYPDICACMRACMHACMRACCKSIRDANFLRNYIYFICALNHDGNISHVLVDQDTELLFHKMTDKQSYI